jgi:hypothetical protein
LSCSGATSENQRDTPCNPFNSGGGGGSGGFSFGNLFDLMNFGTKFGFGDMTTIRGPSSMEGSMEGSMDPNTGLYTFKATVTDGSAFSFFSGSNWWVVFLRSFASDFSLTGARQKGESHLQCINRAQQSLLGNAGQTVLNTVAGISPFIRAGAVPLGPPIQVDTIMIRADVSLPVTERSLNAIEVATNFGISRGLLSPGAMGVARAATPMIAKVSGYVTAAALLAEASFVAACR